MHQSPYPATPSRPHSIHYIDAGWRHYTLQFVNQRGSASASVRGSGGVGVVASASASAIGGSSVSLRRLSRWLEAERV